MTQIFTRDEFIVAIDEVLNGHGTVNVPDHPLWIPELFSKPHVTCLWFVNVKPLKLVDMTKDLYWNWIHDSCKGSVRCFCSDSENNEEWWGFTNREDITFWLLKWANR